jgi:hypothetical protein
MKKAQKGVVVKKKNQLGKRSIADKSKRKEDRVANKAAKKYKPKTGRPITKKAAERKDKKGKGYEEMYFGPKSSSKPASFRQYSGKARRSQKKRVRNLSKDASLMDKVDAYQMNMSGSKSRPIKQKGGRVIKGSSLRFTRKK